METAKAGLTECSQLNDLNNVAVFSDLPVRDFTFIIGVVLNFHGRYSQQCLRARWLVLDFHPENRKQRDVENCEPKQSNECAVATSSVVARNYFICVTQFCFRKICYKLRFPCERETQFFSLNEFFRGMRKEAANFSIPQQKTECMNFSIYLKLINIPVILHFCIVGEKANAPQASLSVWGWFMDARFFCNKSFDEFGLSAYALHNGYLHKRKKCNFAQRNWFMDLVYSTFRLQLLYGKCEILLKL